MTADVVSLLPVSEAHQPRGTIPCADFAVVEANLISEGTGGPAIHPRRRHRNPVNRAAFNRFVPADLCKTGPPEELACSRDMFELHKPMRISVLVWLLVIFQKRSPGHTQGGINRKFAEKKFKVIPAESDIGIQIANDVEGQPFHAFVTRVKCMCLGRKFPALPF